VLPSKIRRELYGRHYVIAEQRAKTKKPDQG